MELEMNIEDLQKEYKRLKNDLESKEKDLNNQNNTVKQDQENIDKRQKEFDGAENERQKQENELARLTERKDKISRQKTDLQNDPNPEQAKRNQEKIDNLEKQEKELIDEIAEADNELQQKTASVKDLDEKLKRAKNQLDKDKEDALIKAADPTGSGKVTLDGFKAACVAFRKAAHAIMKDPVKLEAEAKKIFEKLDKDKKGYLDVAVIRDIEENKLSQLKVPMPQLPKEKKEALLKLADPEGTGKITLENYLKMTKAVVEKMKADGLLED